MLTIPHLPLADLAETLRVVMPIIFVVIYGIAHLVGALQQEKKKRVQRPPQRDPVEAELDRSPRAGADRDAPVRSAPGRGEPGLGKPVSLEETLRREVEEFLKRAQGEPKSSPQAKRPVPPQRSRSAAEPPKSRPQQPAEPTTRRLVDDPKAVTGRKQAEPVLEIVRPGAPTGAAVDAYVAEQMRGVSGIGQHAQRLGEEVALADDRMLAQLQQKFDHRVGTLAPSSASKISPQEVSPGSSAAREFRELLARPGGMRQIIIANEILRRPEERW